MGNSSEKINKSAPELLTELVEALGQAAGAASQLVHVSGDPAKFMTIRSALELAKEGVMILAPQGLTYANPQPKPKLVI